MPHCVFVYSMQSTNLSDDHTPKSNHVMLLVHVVFTVTSVLCLTATNFRTSPPSDFVFSVILVPKSFMKFLKKKKTADKYLSKHEFWVKSEFYIVFMTVKTNYTLNKMFPSA